MTIPKSFKHGNHTWKIRLKEIMKDGFLGLTHADRLRVTLDPTLPAGLVRETAFHELCHVVLARQPHGLDHDKEERVVKIMAPALLAILRRNPDLVEYLLED